MVAFIVINVTLLVQSSQVRYVNPGIPFASIVLTHPRPMVQICHVRLHELFQRYRVRVEGLRVHAR